MEPLDTLEHERWIDRTRRVLTGLKAPKDSGEYKSAVMVMERTLGPSFAAATVCGIVLILLITFVATQAIPTDTEIEVQVIEAETVDIDIDEIELPPPEPLDPIEMVDNTVAPPDAAPTTHLEADVLGVGPTDDAQQMIPNAPLITRSPIILRNLYGNRSAAGRAAAVRRYGGSQRTESAVLNALRWLKANQDDDGSWRRADALDPIAMAGLATLTYLSYGVTPDHEEFGPTLSKALQYLLSVQRGDGLFPGGRGYTHGIAAYAVAEAYAMTRVMVLRDPVERAIRVIVRGQQPGGGFDYDFRKGERWDTSVAGWMVQAMKAASMAGIQIEDAGEVTSLPGEGFDEADLKPVERAMRRAGRFLANDAWDPQRNMFRYSGGRAGGINMTGIGVLSMQLLGQLRHPSVRNGIASLSEQNFRWNPEGNNPVYNWYYDTQALFHQGGSAWDRWNNQFSEALVNAQDDDGKWTGARRGGPVYATTFNVLMLMVYYRYLPTFQTPEEIAIDVNAFSHKEDVVIDVL